MHQAEDILVGRDAAVAPLYFYTQSYMINPGLKAFYTPLGYFFFTNSELGN
jgi:oligopeptide transport system substrate-binding protein